MVYQWIQILNLIQSDQYLPPPLEQWVNDRIKQNFNYSKETLLSAIFVAFPKSRLSFAQTVFEEVTQFLNKSGLNLSQSSISLLFYALILIVEVHPKYFKTLVDFKFVGLWGQQSAVAANFRILLQSRTQSLLQGTMMNMLPEVEVQQRFDEICTIARQFHAELDNITIALDSSLCIEDYFIEPLPTKKICSNNTVIRHSRMIEGLEELRCSLEEHPIAFVFGLLGMGKSELVRCFAQDAKYDGLVPVHLDSSVDFSSLLGAYACTQKTGVFEYREGPILHAAREGHLLLLENVQEASEDVLLSLSQMIKDKSIKSQGQSVYVHPKFKVVAIGSSESEQACMRLKQNLLLLFKYPSAFIYCHPPHPQDIQLILSQQYPLMFSPSLIQLTLGLMDLFKQQASLRDYIILFQRLSKQLDAFYGSDIPSTYVAEELRRKFFIEVYEVMMASIPKQQIDGIIVDKCLQLMGLATDELPLLIYDYNPHIKENQSYISTFKLGEVSRNLYNQNIQINSTIVYTTYSSQILEKILTCIINREPCLLVSDTGCGKTTISQHCAALFGQKLRVFNLSEGADAQDLVGGFRPLDLPALTGLALRRFLKCFLRTANPQKNAAFVQKLQSLHQKRNLRVLIKAMLKTIEQVMPTCAKPAPWNKLEKQLLSLQDSIKNEAQMGFYFLTGTLIKAMQKGYWVLIDEINLASNELLQKLIPAIEGKEFLFLEHGDRKPIPVHPNFRLIGCMNPGSDVGKKELPINVRRKFTTFYIEEMEDRNDLGKFIEGILRGVELGAKYHPMLLATLYLKLKGLSHSNEIGANVGGVHYSLRNLARALNFMKTSLKNNATSNRVDRCLYNALALGFGSGLNIESMKKFNLVISTDLGIQVDKLLPLATDSKGFIIHPTKIEIYGFHIARGRKTCVDPDQSDFLVTAGNLPSLLSLLRAVSGSGLPVLLEGATSAGKTSLVKFVAEMAGQQCHRINNHQNTEIEEYLGTYTSIEGHIKFQEGLLVTAIRNGDWVILDELNLARSEILENLNRLLDDNNELFLPETQETLRPHPNFRIFATQNPVTYAGRRMLSKAFRNRFIQIEVPEASQQDMTAIIKRRCIYVPPSYVPLMLQTYRELNLYRSSDHIFMQAGGMITLRDLIKWGCRLVNNISEESTRDDLAIEGYCLLVERLRDASLKQTTKEALERIFKTNINPDEYYRLYLEKTELKSSSYNQFIQWNPSFIRMAALAHKSLTNHEPALLVGPAGIGKTTLTQLLSHVLGTQHYQIVAHQYMEVSDFVGALRPVRQESQSIFQWEDGPLLQAIKGGGVFLIDEINMAPESVLEGLNSVLEMPASLTVNEHLYTAPENAPFVIIAAMNPSGDWGKKELTPALRSRFTEIYAENPLNGDLAQLIDIIDQFLPQEQTLTSQLADSQLCESTVQQEMSLTELISRIFYTYNQSIRKRFSLNELTFRDLLNIKSTLQNLQDINPSLRYYYALEMCVFMALENEVNPETLNIIRFELLANQTIIDSPQLQAITREGKYLLGSFPFYTNISRLPINEIYAMHSIQAQANLLKLIKAITLEGKPVMLQGMPSSGKSAAVEFLANLKGKQIRTILVDEHTDLSELLGTDQPNTDPKSTARFAFVKGPLLSGILEGDWIILKNLNLAPQNIIEGLNSIFDHRQEVFIPETGCTYTLHHETKLFVIQNPPSYGGGRKNLPASFMNRFIKVNFLPYNHEDQKLIASHCNPKLPQHLIEEHHNCIMNVDPNFLDLHSYLKYFKTIANSSNIAQAVRTCLNFRSYDSHSQLIKELGIDENINWDEQLNNKLMTRDIALNRTQKQTLETLLYLFSLTEKTDIIALYIQGGSGQGKKYCINKLAKIHHKKVRYLQLSSSADSQDLFGTYQQFNSQSMQIQHQKELKSIVKQILSLCCSMESYNRFQSLLNQNVSRDSLLDAIKYLEESQMVDEDKVGHFKSEIEYLCYCFSQNDIFIWQYSQLVKAAIIGDWVVFQNIDRINPTILPKINGLCSMKSQQDLPLLYGRRSNITIHKDFRIFITDNNTNPLVTNINIESIKSKSYTLNMIQNDNIYTQQGTNHQISEDTINIQMYHEELLSHSYFELSHHYEIVQNSLRLEIQSTILQQSKETPSDQLILIHQEKQILEKYLQLNPTLLQKQIMKKLDQQETSFQTQLKLSMDGLQQIYYIQYAKIHYDIRNKIESLLLRLVQIANLPRLNLIFLSHLICRLSMLLQPNDHSQLIIFLSVIQLFMDNGKTFNILNYQAIDPFQGYDLYQGRQKVQLSLLQNNLKRGLFKSQSEWDRLTHLNLLFRNFDIQSTEVMNQKWIYIVGIELGRAKGALPTLQPNMLQMIQSELKVKVDGVHNFDDFIALNYMLPSTEDAEDEQQHSFESFICIDPNQVNLMVRFMLRTLENAQKCDSAPSLIKVHSQLEYQNDHQRDQNFLNYWLHQTLTLIRKVEYESLLLLINNQCDERQEYLTLMLENVPQPEEFMFLMQSEDFNVEVFIQIQLMKDRQNLESKQVIINRFFEALIGSSINELQLWKPVARRLISSLSHHTYLSNKFGSNENEINQFASRLQVDVGESQNQFLADILKTSISIFNFEAKDLEKISLKINQEYVDSSCVLQVREFLAKFIEQQELISFLWTNQVQLPNKLYSVQLNQIMSLYEIKQQQVNLRHHNENSLSTTEKFLNENQVIASHLYRLVDKLSSPQNIQEFIHHAKRFIFDNYSKYWVGFKDILYPIIESLYYIIQSIERTEQSTIEIPPSTLITQLYENRPIDSILTLAGNELLSDQINADDKLGAAKYKQYLQNELQNLIRSEYEVERPNKVEEEKANRENLSKLISRSLNELEVTSHEIMKYLLKNSNEYQTLDTPLLKLMRAQTTKYQSFAVELNINRLMGFQHYYFINMYQQFESNKDIFGILNNFFGFLGKMSQQIKLLSEDDLFYENQILLEIMKLIKNINNQPSFQTSTRSFASSLLILHKKIEQWNVIVPKMYHIDCTVGNFQDILTNLLKLQKYDHDTALTNRVEQLWHVEAIIAVKFYQELKQINPLDIDKVFNSVNSYMGNQTLASYDFRLSFLHLLVKIPVEHINTIQQIINFYSIFQGFATNDISTMISEYNETFKEEQRLVSWQSTNIGILEGLVERLHQKITKHVRKFGTKIQESFRVRVMDTLFNKIICPDIPSFISGNMDFQQTKKKQQKYLKISYYKRKTLFIPSKVQTTKQLNIENSHIEFASSWITIEIKIQQTFQRMKELQDIQAKQNIKQRSLEEFYKYLEINIGLSKQLKGNSMQNESYQKCLLNCSAPYIGSSYQKTVQNYYQAIFYMERLNASQFTQSIPKNLQFKGLSFLHDLKGKLAKHIERVYGLASRCKREWILSDMDTIKLVLYSPTQQIKIEQIMNDLSKLQSKSLIYEKHFEYVSSMNVLKEFKQIMQSSTLSFYRASNDILYLPEERINELKCKIRLMVELIDKCASETTLKMQQKDAITFNNCLIMGEVKEYCTTIYCKLQELQRVIEANIQVETNSLSEQFLIDIIKRNHLRVTMLLKKYQTDLSECFFANLTTGLQNTVYKNEFKFINTFTLLTEEMSRYQDQLLRFQLQSNNDKTVLSRYHKRYCTDYMSVLMNIIKNVKTFSKFFVLLTKVFSNIFVNGFCLKEDEEGDGKGDDDGAERDGTGIGEGAGRDNVNEEIEHEEQVLGERKEQEEKQDENIEKDSNEMEMENDFEGENQSIEEEPEVEQDKKDEDEQPEEEEKHASDVNSEVHDEEGGDKEDLESGSGNEMANEEENDNEKDQNKKELQAADDDDDVKGSMKSGDDNNSEFSLESNADIGDEIEDESAGDDEQDLPEQETNEMEDADKSMSVEGEDQKEVEDQNIEENQELSEQDDKQPQEELEQLQDEQDTEAKELNKEDENKEDEIEQNNHQDGEQQKREQVKEDQDKKKQKEKEKIPDLDSPDQEDNQIQTAQPNEEQFQQKENAQENLIEQDMQDEINLPNTQIQYKDQIKFNQQNEQKEQQEKQDDYQEAQINFNDERYNQVTQLPTDFNPNNIKGIEEQNVDQKVQQQMKEKSVLENDPRSDQNATIEKRREYYNYDDPKIQEEPQQVAQGVQWKNIQQDILLWSSLLSEELKTVLKPTKCQGLKGDYKTGKRLNMKKVIPFIASNFKKDKIWLRRSLPTKRTYQIVAALDNSLSMSENDVGPAALQSLLSLALALQKMEAGTLQIVKLSDQPEVVKTAAQSLDIYDIPRLIEQFDFAQHSEHSQDRALLNLLEMVMDDYKEQSFGQTGEQFQICFIISDGRFNKNVVKPLLKRAEEQHILFIFIIIDGAEPAKSIFNLKSTSIEIVAGKSQIKIYKYLEDFPFKHYIVIQDPSKMNQQLTSIIRQYFDMYST